MEDELLNILKQLPKQQQIDFLAKLLKEPENISEADKSMLANRKRRSKAAEVTIPKLTRKQRNRRKKCLANPVLFLKVYGRKVFYQPFCDHHLQMIHAVVERAKSGGDKAIAAPRGSGKSSVVTWLIVYIMLAKYVEFPVIVASTRKHAFRIFKQIKHIFEHNDLLAQDFPEICACVKELAGSPQRAAKQHIAGKNTRISWTQDYIALPHVNGYENRYLTYYGLDSAIRGVQYNSVRPDFILIDDPETREVAFSEDQNYKVEEMIDGDIAGLAGPDKRVSRVILTTIQNKRCYSYRVTDSKIKPTFEGERHGVIQQFPLHTDLWEEYVALRQSDQANGHKDGPNATKFYLDNYDKMHEGVIVTNPHRFISVKDDDGNAIEHSALQSFYNRIADWGSDRVFAELQNDPQEDVVKQEHLVNPGKILNNTSNLQQNELPLYECKITIGVDVGKYYSHWVKVAWFGNSTGCIIDYGIVETLGLNTSSQKEAVELALLKSLLMWKEDICRDRIPDFVLVDSGDMSQAIYEFVRRAGGFPFAASKGWANHRFSLGKLATDRRLFNQCYAHFIPEQNLWLYNVNTEHWKNWVHERFATPVFNDNNQYNSGSLSLYTASDMRQHLSFAQHICAEESRETFVPDKGMIKQWVVVNRNNHYLDALALACAGSNIVGNNLIETKKPIADTIIKQQPKKPPVKNNIMQRPGGWLQSINNRRRY